MKALKDRVILRPDDLDDQVTASGIVIAQMEESIPMRADGNPIASTVVSVGPDADPEIEVGMRVYCTSRTGNADVFEYEDQLYASVPSNEIEAIISAD